MGTDVVLVVATEAGSSDLILGVGFYRSSGCSSNLMLEERCLVGVTEFPLEWW